MGPHPSAGLEILVLSHPLAFLRGFLEKQLLNVGLCPETYAAVRLGGTRAPETAAEEHDAIF